MWEPHKFVSDALMLMNDVGDVQTALTVLIALGEARKLLPIEDALVVVNDTYRGKQLGKL